MTTLNHAQKAVVLSEEPFNVVVAGPGSGKTKTLCERIRYRIGLGVDPKTIVVLTFTNAAAHEIAERLAGVHLGYIGTLHGFCFRLIQKHGHRLGYKAGAVAIVTEEDRETMIGDTVKRLGVKLSRKAIDLNEKPDARMVWRELRHTLKRSNIVDYDRILEDGLALALLPAVAKEMNISELYVDEAQDSGAEDWAIYDALKADVKTIIGDTDQSIYGFRGARPELFHGVAKKPFVLDLNYRSDAAICLAANALISHNTQRTPKLTQPVSTELGEVTMIDHASGRAEAFAILQTVTAAIREHEPKEIAILSRTNAIAGEIRALLNEAGIPLAGASDVNLPYDWSYTLATFAMTIDPHNDVTCERWMREAKFGLKQINVAKIAALNLKKSIAEVSSDDLPSLRGTLDEALIETARFCSTESRLLMEERAALLPQKNDATPADLLHDLWNHKEWNGRKPRPGVYCGTIHGAKGREFDLVIVAGCEDGILPSRKTDGDLEEERRLMFVAVTRARHTLYLSWAKTRTAYGKTSDQQPSRFLQELTL